MNYETHTTIREEGFIFAGDIYLELADKKELGLFPLGNATEFKISMQTETKERIGRGAKNYGQVLDSITLPKPAEFSISINTLNRENLAMALSGTLKQNSQNAQNIQDEALAYYPDAYLKLKHRKIDGSKNITVKAVDDEQVIEAQHIELDEALGAIKISAASGLTPGEMIKVSYSTQASEHSSIQAFVKNELKGRMLIDGINRSNGKKVYVSIPSFSLAINGDFNLFSEDFNSVSFKGKALLAEGELSPMTMEVEA